MKGALRHGMKIIAALAVLFLSSLSHAQSQSIQLPAGGTSYTSSSGLFTVWNPPGEFSAAMPAIYALQFGPSTYFYYKVGTTARWGTFTSWTFAAGVFSGTFTGWQIEYVSGTWIMLSQVPISGTVTWSQS